ncbi:60s acidic ribosomal protein-domain-containing protein [Globomyces pollinis-pini]|nr:60s acidic ribosomal protein-domain-containing protein [Globomyces pollinis-pini]
MKFLAAYLLANLAEGETTSAQVNAILAAAGIEADSERIESLVSELAGKNIEEVIAEGASKLASVPSGAGAVAAAPKAGGAAAADAPAAEEKEEEKEESDDDMGFGLFD